SGAGLDERDDFVGGHRMRTGLARITAKRAVAAIVATQRGQRDEDLLRERYRLAGTCGSGAREELRKRRWRCLDEPSRRVVRDHLESRAPGLTPARSGATTARSGATPARSGATSARFRATLAGSGAMSARSGATPARSGATPTRSRARLRVALSPSASP